MWTLFPSPGDDIILITGHGRLPFQPFTIPQPIRSSCYHRQTDYTIQKLYYFKITGRNEFNQPETASRATQQTDRCGGGYGEPLITIHIHVVILIAWVSFTTSFLSRVWFLQSLSFYTTAWKRSWQWKEVSRVDGMHWRNGATPFFIDYGNSRRCCRFFHFPLFL